MSHAEAQQWAAYMRRRGTLNTGARLELGFALLASLVVKAMGGKAAVKDFMMSSDVEDEGDATLDDVMSALMGAKR